MINKTTIKNLFKTLLVVFVLVCNSFSLQAQGFDKYFIKNTDEHSDMEFQFPPNYLTTETNSSHYQPWDFRQMPLMYSIKHKKHDIIIAFTMVSTKPNTPQKKRMREVLGNLDKIHPEVIAKQADTTISKIKYLDTLQLQKVNANRGVIYNMRINNKYMGQYARCRKIEIYKDNIGRAEILFFYNKEDEALVDEEITKTLGMLKYK